MARIAITSSGDDLSRLRKIAQTPGELAMAKATTRSRGIATRDIQPVSVPSAESNGLENESDEGREEKETEDAIKYQSSMKTKLKRRILNKKTDNPLLRPIGSTGSSSATFGLSVSRPKPTTRSKEKKQVVMDTPKSNITIRADEGLGSNKENLDRYSHQLLVPIAHKRSSKEIDAGPDEEDQENSNQDVDRSLRPPSSEIPSETEDVIKTLQPGSKKEEKNEKSTETKEQGREYTGLESDEDDMHQESDGLSDFIVNDSSCQEDDSDSSIPTPRPRRRLVRGRRLRSQSSDSDELGPQMMKLSLGGLGKKQVDNDTTNRPIEESFCLGEKQCIEDDFRKELEGTKQQVKGTYVKTPPQSPPRKNGSLISPKKTPRIPLPPHRPGMGSFWSQEAVNEWNDEYSPRKMPKPKSTVFDREILDEHLLFSPSKGRITQDHSFRAMKKEFSERKQGIAESFLIELDKTITDGQIANITATTGGVKIIWSKTLQTTAGRANWRREVVQASTLGLSDIAPAPKYRHHASIELAEKIINDEDRLLNVMAHEFCHLATFMVSNVKNNPHGKEFKSWGAKCGRHFGNRGVTVTTKHSYTIEYKYIWECTSCNLEYKRHSKSIDPARHRCGVCKSQLLQTKPVPRSGDGKVGEYQKFVKDNMKKIREEFPGSPQKDIMGIIGKRYQDYKASKLREEKANTTDVTTNQLPVSVRRRLEFLDIADLTE
ncbi:hypothetical protein B7463_g12130, partial [Scytalidium lignicola]